MPGQRIWLRNLRVLWLAAVGLPAAGCAVDGSFDFLAALGQKPAEPPAALTLPDEPVPWQRGDLIGTTKAVRIAGNDTLISLARSNDLGYVEIIAANRGIDPWLPGEGTELILPTSFILPPGPRQGIVINLAEQRLYHFPESGLPATYPIGIGRDGYETPLGATKVVRKREGPTWYPPKSARRDDPTLPAAVPPGPENPLGSHALYLDWPEYLIHGTNEPYGIGRRVSRGCIRLYPEDIVKLYDAVPRDTAVRVITAPVKAGWSGGELYMEAHPTLAQADAIEQDGELTPISAPDAREIILKAAGTATERVNWAVVVVELAARRGVPVRITDGAPRQARIVSAAEDAPPSTAQ